MDIAGILANINTAAKSDTNTSKATKNSNKNESNIWEEAKSTFNKFNEAIDRADSAILNKAKEKIEEAMPDFILDDIDKLKDKSKDIKAKGKEFIKENTPDFALNILGKAKNIITGGLERNFNFVKDIFNKIKEEKA